MLFGRKKYPGAEDKAPSARQVRAARDAKKGRDPCKDYLDAIDSLPNRDSCTEITRLAFLNVLDTRCGLEVRRRCLERFL